MLRLFHEKVSLKPPDNQLLTYFKAMENVSKDLLFKRRRQGEKLSRQVRVFTLQNLTNIDTQAA